MHFTKTIKILFCSVLFGLAIMRTSPSAAESVCVAPDHDKVIGVEAYVMAKNHVTSKADIILVSVEQANDSCYWKFTYNLSNSNREITMYLAPDRRHLTPILYDIMVDPRIEERQRLEQTKMILQQGSHPSIGPKDAPITFTLFSDFQCPFCKRLEDVLEKQVIPANAGKIRLVFRNYPLSMHSWAMEAALSAQCAASQSPDAFWKLHDYLFEHQSALRPENIDQSISTFASDDRSLGEPGLKSCVSSQDAHITVQQDIAAGNKLGVRATPTFFVNGVMYTGFKNAADLQKIIDQAELGAKQEATNLAHN